MIICDVCNSENATPQNLSTPVHKEISIDCKMQLDLCVRCKEYFKPEFILKGIVREIQDQVLPRAAKK